MSIEIIEENNSTVQSGLFLPPAVEAARDCGRSALGVACACAFVLAAILLCVCGLSVGAPLAVAGLVLLVAEIIGFKRSNSLNSDFGLPLRRYLYLIAAAVLLAFAVFSKAGDLYYKYLDLLEPLYGFAAELPEPFSDIVGVGFLGEITIFAALGCGLLAVGLGYGSLSRSRRENLPFCTTLLLSLVISVLSSAVLVCDGLARLYVLPSNYLYEDSTESLVTARYCDAGICFIFALVILLQAVRLLTIYLRMRKVKNAVLKA